MKLSFSIVFTIHTSTYRRRNPKQIEGYKRRNLKDMNTTSISRAGSVFWVEPLQKSIKQLQDHLEKVENSITNNLQLESTNSDFVWESYGVWKVRKIERKILVRVQLFLLKMKWRELEIFKRKREREGNRPTKSCHISSWPCGARVPHGARGLVWPCGSRPPHVAIKAWLIWPNMVRFWPSFPSPYAWFSGISPCSNDC